jgi:glyoxylase-like metal-dependent hydrolase (beta-lactamase superfamily II)
VVQFSSASGIQDSSSRIRHGFLVGFSRKNTKGPREDAQDEMKAGEICGALPDGFDRNAYVTRPWKIASWIHDGSRIDLDGRSLEVLATPGHTPKAISLFDRANGLLFAGDFMVQRRCVP